MLLIMECYLIRHAETNLNKEKVLQGWADAELSEDGVMQAERLRGTLPPWPLFTSDLQRAVNTARLLASPGQKVQPDARLREIDVGEWQGMAKAHLEGSSLWQEYQSSPATFRFPGGESLKDLQTRMLGAFHDYRMRYSQIIMVSHHLALKSLLCHFHGWTLDRIHTINIPNTAIIRVRITDESSHVQIEQILSNH